MRASGRIPAVAASAAALLAPGLASAELVWNLQTPVTTIAQQMFSNT